MLAQKQFEAVWISLNQNFFSHLLTYTYLDCFGDHHKPDCHKLPQPWTLYLRMICILFILVSKSCSLLISSDFPPWYLSLRHDKYSNRCIDLRSCNFAQEMFSACRWSFNRDPLKYWTIWVTVKSEMPQDLIPKCIIFLNLLTNVSTCESLTTSPKPKPNFSILGFKKFTKWLTSLSEILTSQMFSEVNLIQLLTICSIVYEGNILHRSMFRNCNVLPFCMHIFLNIPEVIVKFIVEIFSRYWQDPISSSRTPSFAWQFDIRNTFISEWPLKFRVPSTLANSKLRNLHFLLITCWRKTVGTFFFLKLTISQRE